MKKTLLLLTVAAVTAAIFAGCTTVESTQKFNRVSLGSGNEKAVCQTFVEIPGYYFFGIPIVVGSIKGDGSWTMFRDNVTTENAIYLLTKEIKDLCPANYKIPLRETKNNLNKCSSIT